MNYLAAIGLINGILSLGLGCFVLLKNTKAIINVTYFLFETTVALFSFGYFFWQLTSNPQDALFWFRILCVGIIYINITFLHVTLSILGKTKEKESLLQLLYVINTVFVFFNFSSFLYSNLVPKHGYGYWPVPTVLFKIYLFFWLFQAAYGMFLLYRGLLISSGQKREQIKYFMLGSFLGFIGGATNWPLWFNINIPPYLTILIAIHVPLTTYAIMKYRLLNINVFITRAGIFIFVYTLVLGIPFWVGYKHGLWHVATWLMLLFATAGPFIYQYLRKHAEDLILKEQKRYQKALLELAKKMARIRDLDSLLKVITLTVAETVKVSHAAVYIKDDYYKAFKLKSIFPFGEKSRFPELIPFDSGLPRLLLRESRPLLNEEFSQSDKNGLELGVAIPFLIENTLMGFMVLSPKPDNQVYTPDDVLIFETLSYSTSLSIENCSYWKEIEDRQRKARLHEMDTYSYSLAHEIDNPMTVILNNLQFLRQYFLRYITDAQELKDAESCFDFALEATTRVSGMVKAIRDFGSPVTGESKAINVEEVVESFSRLYRPRFKEKAILFEKSLSLPKEPVYVRGEKPELIQVLVILANNSIHALIGAEVRKITVKGEIVSENLMRLSLSDTGYGIEKEKLEIIFASFVTSKASTEGTGMGLHNAKKIVERHKGRIWAESEGKGKGSTFFIELPIAQDVTEEEIQKGESKIRAMFFKKKS